MAGQKYNKAYEAYQQAVYRDGRNPTFWCSIGVLYFQINQYRDALDAYSRAIRINPYIPEVWFDLGSLYESCNNQIGDAIDAYARAAELDPGNTAITQRLHLLKHSQATGAQLPAAPAPQDVHPTAYASVAPPPGLGGLPLLHVNNSGRPVYRADSRGPGGEVGHHPPHISGAETSPAPFRGGPPPPVVIDESRHAPSPAQLAPMDVDHIPHGREAPYPHPPSARDSRQLPLTSDPHPRETEGMRGAVPHDPYYSRGSRAGSIPPSPPAHASRPRSPYHNYPAGRVQVTAGSAGTHRSPHVYPREPSGNGPTSERDANWDRREWERRDSSRRRGGPPYPPGPSPPPRALSPRARSPSQTSPSSAHPSRAYWDSRPTHTQLQPRSPRAPPSDFGAARPVPGDRNDYWQNRISVDSPPESSRNPRVAPPTFTGSTRGSESPHLTTSQRPVDPATEYKDRRRRGTREKEMEMAASPGDEAPKRDRRRRPNARQKNERGRTVTPKPYGGPPNQNPPFKVTYPKRDESAGPSSSAGSGSQSRSAQPSPTSTVPVAPTRVVDEDYDEGVADALMDLASYRAPEQASTFPNGPSTSAGRPISPSPSMRSHSHRGSVSSTRSRATPPSTGSTTMKRPLSPGPDEIDAKRTKVELPTRKASPPAPPSSGRSPTPFRTQPSSHSPENRQGEKKHPSYPSSPQLPSVLPLPPRPLGAGLSHSSNSVALPPIATLSPASTAPSPAHEVERVSIDRTQSRSASPHAQAAPRGKFMEVMNSEPSNNAEPPS